MMKRDPMRFFTAVVFLGILLVGGMWATAETDAKPTPLYPLKYG